MMKSAGTGSSDLRGAALILLSALSSAGYSVLARKMTRTFNSLELTYVTTGAGFLFSTASPGSVTWQTAR